MHLLVFHGYLLRGTGSNVYNARLVPALVRAGHTVDLLAQDARAHELDWVDAVGRLAADGAVTGVEVLREPVAVTVWQPDLGGLLPVYVKDRYPGFAVKTFVECSAEDVETYVAANASAIAAVAQRRRPDLALVNHLVMGPLAAARGLPPGVPYAVKVHGSDLEYAVAIAPGRFVGAALQGVTRAATLLVGSGHTARRMFELLGDTGLAARTRLGPPGVDTLTFAPRTRAQARAEVRAVADGLLAAPARAGDGGSFARDEHAIACALLSLDLSTGPHVAYVGKLLRNKGVDLLAAAWPIVLAARPDAQLVVVGFGDFAAPFDALVTALGAGDLDRVRELCVAHGLRHLAAFLDAGGADAPYLAAARGMPARVTRTGRLEHHELAPLLSACTAQVVPSTFPEAFGMVAAEAAAAGALPIVAAHSGLDEVAAVLAPGLPPEAQTLLRFEIGPRTVADIADRLLTWLALAPDRQAAGRGDERRAHRRLPAVRLGRRRRRGDRRGAGPARRPRAAAERAGGRARRLEDHDRRADRQQRPEPRDRRVGHPDAPVRGGARDERRLVRAVDTDHAAARPVAERRVGARAERVRSVGRAAGQPAQPAADPEGAARSRRRPRADADRRGPDAPARAVQGRPPGRAVDAQHRADRLEFAEVAAGNPAGPPVGALRKADVQPRAPRRVDVALEHRVDLVRPVLGEVAQATDATC